MIRAFLVGLTMLMAGCSTPDKPLTLESFELKTLQGDTINLGDYKGKTVFINVWATWCRPCIQEMPTIAAAMEKLKGRDIVFLFASSEDLNEIAAFRDRRAFPFDYVQLQNLEALSIEAIPATFIFSPSGEMVFGEEGFRNWSTPENLQLITQGQDL